MRFFFKKMKEKYFYFSCLMATTFFCNLACADASGDLLANAIPQGQITNTFGPGSRFAYCIYVGEIVLGTVAYIKTKNIFALTGIVVLMLFTAAAFSLIGS